MFDDVVGGKLCVVVDGDVLVQLQVQFSPVLAQCPVGGEFVNGFASFGVYTNQVLIDLAAQPMRLDVTGHRWIGGNGPGWNANAKAIGGISRFTGSSTSRSNERRQPSRRQPGQDRASGKLQSESVITKRCWRRELTRSDSQTL